MGVTWLHVSDFHFRGGDPYDRDVVLRALVKSVAEYRERGRAPDVIFATGDIAHGGKEEEYVTAGKFFDDLLAAAHLEKKRLFVIPGNHDVDRDLGIGLARTLESREQSDAYFRTTQPKPHLTQKLGAFSKWHNEYFAGIRESPGNSTCGPAEALSLNGQRLGILPINSALFCQGDDDHDKLWIGRRCLDAGLAELRKIGGETNIVLVHHPLDWLSALEGANIQAELEATAHILLRGHLHETRVETVASAEGRILRCAAGAAYQSRKWPNRALYGTLDGGQLTIYPIRYEDAPREIWTTDSSVFPRDDKHQRSFAIAGVGAAPAESHTSERPPSPLRFRSNVKSRGAFPFVGREDLITQIGEILSDPSHENVVILHGPPGVGKSELACEYARRSHDRYSGGTYFVDASTDAVAINLAAIGTNILDLPFRSNLPLTDQGQQTFHALGALPVLLIYDNVVSFERISPWLPFNSMPCHVVITTLLDASDPKWPCLEVKLLSPAQSLELVEKLTGGQLPEKFSKSIVEHANGLPVQIIPAATTLAYEQRRGRLGSAPLSLQKGAGDSFRAAYDRLERPARLLLHAAAFLNPQHIVREEILQHLCQGLGWSKTEFDRSLDACFDLHLLSGVPDPSMHQLFARFIRETAMAAEDQVALRQVGEIRAKRFVELAGIDSRNPADAQAATVFLSYPLDPTAWGPLGELVTVEDGETVGRALYEIGRFKQSRPWFERAVEAKEKGDVAGRIDHAGLGRSLHQVGYCLSSTGEYEQARPWYERAVEAAEKGDVHGRIDHGSLGRNLHQVGYCLSGTGEYEQARPWYERAVEAAEKGDVHGASTKPAGTQS